VGASRKAIVGAVLGTFAGLFVFPPFGLFVGPFAGALIGELLHGRDSARAPGRLRHLARAGARHRAQARLAFAMLGVFALALVF
jgi:uncharacterized protein YqgC (DUF456 family)